MYESSERVRRLCDISLGVEGMPRNMSTHAAGVVISDKPVSDYAPLAVSGNVTVTQFDMDSVSSLGLLKFDFLGLTELTTIDNCVRAIRERVPNFDIDNIPLDDKKTYELLSRGDTVGVFQLESSGMRRMLAEMKPSCIRDVMVALALYRPGSAKFIDTFLANRKSGKKLSYPIPSLAAILDETNGCIVYQEQVMEIFRAVAGYSYAKADIVRRAISKKKHGVIEAEQQEQEILTVSIAYTVDAEPVEDYIKAGSAPTIVTQPKSQTVCVGDVVTFMIVANNAETYQWYYLTPDADAWKAVTAASGKTSSYSFTTAARHNGYQYRCEVGNTAGSKTSSTVTLTVVTAPTITSQPESKTAYVGETVQFKVVAEGATAYQWYYLTPDSDTWSIVTTNGKSDTYTLTAAARHNGYQYRCEVSNTAGSKTSSAAALTVISAPTITEQPESKTVSVGETVQFKIVATGATAYQWYYLTPDSDAWTIVTTNGKSDTYTLTAAARHNGNQ